jgi:serine/threonine protein kinase
LQERFLNEAKRQAQLRHSNIVPCTDFFQVEGRSYMVMEYVEGQSLDARLQKSNPPLTLNKIHTISWDVLSALDYAHSLDVVHRDVKPANMLMDQSGRTMLMDFGIAKALREERSLTLAGTAIGTPDYMSPEQILQPNKVEKVVKEVGYMEQPPHFEEVAIPADAPYSYRERVTGLRRMSLNFRFRLNSIVLDNKALADIPRAITALSQNRDRTNVQILGFADSKESPIQNQRLCEQRAQVVADRLRAYGIRVETAGFSSAMPVGDNSTDDGREKNRRVEVWAH